MQQLSFRFHEKRNIGGLENSLSRAREGLELLPSEPNKAPGGGAGPNLAAEDSPAAEE